MYRWEKDGLVRVSTLHANAYVYKVLAAGFDTNWANMQFNAYGVGMYFATSIMLSMKYAQMSENSGTSHFGMRTVGRVTPT